MILVIAVIILFIICNCINTSKIRKGNHEE